MNSYYRKDKKELTKEAIIGLGEDSFKKNYYAELQDKILELEKVNVRNKTLMKTIPDIMLVANREGLIMPFSYTNASLRPFTIDILKNREITKKLKEAITDVVNSNQMTKVYFEIENNKKVGYFEARMNVSEMKEILIIIRDITEEKELEQKLRNMAETDPLTGLYNRTFYEKQLTSIESKEKSDIAMILFDIDGLKLINDTLGSLTGDKLLKHVSHLIREVFNGESFLARVGGDEFVALTAHMRPKEIEKRLMRLNMKISESTIFSKIFTVSVSYGYSYHQKGLVNTALMFQEADNNMHQNKMLKEYSTKNQLVKTLMKTLEAKDYITEGHADRMEKNALLLSKELQLTQSMIDKINLLTKFHDIGKVGIPDSILKKEGKLTEQEWEIMKTHCAIGERIANESAELKEISYLILTHQEKWDGTGYPLGLQGVEIPLESRILALSDAFDAMTNDRPYRKALSVSEAIQEIIDHKGTQFDPELVDIFLLIINKHK